MSAHDRALALLMDRRAFPVGSPDWNWRTTAAWKLDQMHRGVPACDWTNEPPQGLTGPCQLDTQHRIAAE